LIPLRSAPELGAVRARVSPLLLVDGEDDLMAAFREKLQAEATFDDAASANLAPVTPTAPIPAPVPAPAPASAPTSEVGEQDLAPDYFSNPFATTRPEGKKMNAVDVENEKRANFLKQQKDLAARRSKGEFDQQEKVEAFSLFSAAKGISSELDGGVPLEVLGLSLISAATLVYVLAVVLLA